MSMAFGSLDDWTYRGVLDFLFCGVNPFFLPDISWNRRYCASNREAFSYQAAIVVGTLSSAKILARIEV